MKAVMYGAGNIGRGFIGQLFYKSGYDVCFIDVNENVINELNIRKSYPVVILSNSDAKEEPVSGVSCINGRDTVKTADAIAEADVMATAVGVNILPFIVDNIAEGIRKRFIKANIKPLNILICENKIGADKYLEDLIKQRLTSKETALFDQYIGLVEASIGRMVPVQTPQMQKGDILRVCVETYDKLPVDRAAFKGEIPDIKNMIPYSPFEFYIERKLFIHNMGHAMTAYLGSLLGYEFIYESIALPNVELCVLRAMTESGLALSKKHAICYDELNSHIEDLIYRFSNKKLGDTAARVGGDLKRKLSPNDRLIGALELCKEQKVKPYYICMAIAAAMLFKDESRCYENPKEILDHVCQMKRDYWYDHILNCYDGLKSGATIEWMMQSTKERMVLLG